MCLGALLAAAPLFASQQGSKGPVPGGAITGMVVDGSSGAAVAGAVVMLATDPERPIEAQTRQLTDDKGRFAFLDLPPAPAYVISASKHGYLPGGYGREASSAEQLRPIRLAGEWVPNVRVVLWRPGSIGGIVRDEAGEPVVGVLVRAIARFRMAGRDQLAAGQMTVTDDRGGYRLSGLAPGRYVIQVPSVQASIPAGIRYRPSSPIASDPDAALDIDDSSRLVIGKYPLPPPPLNGRAMAYPMAFHPAGAAIAQATIIDLKYGDDRANADVSLTPVPAPRVSGTVEGPPEAMSSLTLRLLPAGLESLGQGAEVATALVGAGGQFTFLNVPAGTYTIDAPLRISEFTTTIPARVSFPLPPGRYGWQRQMEPIEGVPGLQFMSTDFRGGEGANYSGRATVTVDAADVHGVVIRLRANAAMAGRIVAEADPAQPGSPMPANFTVVLDPAGGEASMDMPRPRANPPAGDDFTIAGIMPGSYWLRVQKPPGWLVKSVIWRGRDYAHEPFDAAASDDFSGVVVTVTNVVPELSGSVRGTDDLKPDRTVVIVFPANRSQWQGAGVWPPGMKSAPVSSDGTFRITTVPAGDYFVAAIDRAHYSAWRDPDFLAGVERSGARVTLSWGVKTTQDVKVAAVRGESSRQR
jgi:hypothetical protein